MSDNLWIQIVDDSQKAYEELYYSSYDSLMNYGLRLLDNRSLVEDAIQTVFLTIWSKRKKLKIHHSIQNYLFTCLRRQIFSELQRNKELYDKEMVVNFHLYLSNQNNSDHDVRTKLDQVLLEVEKLPNRQKEIIYLKYMQNLSYDEIEEIMAISRNSLYKLLHKAIDKLRRLGI